MKELSIEEKAKAYDKVREKIALRFGSNVADEIFLKESEDEMIRKALIELVHDTTGDSLWVDYNVHKEDALAWLEKQGEQNPAEDKGMNLVEEEMTPFQKKVFCIIDTSIEEEQGLKQVCEELLALAANEIEQKFTWSEEDESRMDNLCHFLEEYGNQYYGHLTLQGTISWLKSIKDRVGCEADCTTTKEWSEEDKEIIEALISLCDAAQDNIPQLSALKNWLKSLKYRAQSQNLTITDEELINARNEAYNDALDKLEYHSDTPTFNDGWSAAIWYVKKRDIIQSQATWKPSDEQMNTLKSACGGNYVKLGILESLYVDLKKLREE